ncbi:MAG: hypothetical protein SFW67_24290 [Myxococcaceae bacterium]|nr:hypothetical protein [Myxococcaceae bacterium]
MKISATRLRAELYRMLDEVLETGRPVEVSRPKGTLVIQRAALSRRKRRKKPASNPDVMVGDPDDFIHFDWSGSWKPTL